MATTKKKPSAAQLAARKLFAQRAKAGTLKKSTTKRQKSEENTRHFGSGGVEAAEAALRIAKKHAARKTNPVKRAPAKRSKKFCVYDGSKVVGEFDAKTNAVEFAQMYADKHKRTVSVG